jgi:sulfur carrier protein ThiS
MVAAPTDPWANAAQQPLTGGMQLTVPLLANDGAGFADNVVIPAGTTLASLMWTKGIRETDRVIRVNNSIVDRNYVLRQGDRVSILPQKIAGASQIGVLFMMNEGNGCAEQITVPAGATIAQLLSRKTSNPPSNYVIRVNNMTVAADYALQNGDRVSITPAKVRGA